MSQPMAAWRATYTPGPWLALTGPTTMVVMPPPPADRAGAVTALWEDVVAAGSLDALLRAVAEIGLDSLPDLGAFHWDDDGLHGLARGNVEVVDAQGGDVVLSGEGSVTWREEHLGRERVLTVSVADGPDEPQLPLVVGAASVSSVSLSTEPSALVHFPGAGQADEWDESHGDDQDVEYGIVQDDVEDSFTNEDLEGTELWDPEVGEQVSQAEPYADTDDDDIFADEPSFDDRPVAAPPVDPDMQEGPLAEPASLSSPGEAAPEPFVPADEWDDGEEVIFSASAPEAREPEQAPVAPQASAVSAVSAASAAEPEPARVQVLAVPCTNNHPNAPGARTCRICQYPVDSSNPRMIDRPVLAGVHTNRGDFADIVSGVIIGRAPDAAKGPEGSHLMRVSSPSNDISRNHVLVTTEEWNVLVTDLNSTNGTTVLPNGEPPFTLRDGASVQVGIGTVLDLGDGVSLRIEPPRR